MQKSNLTTLEGRNVVFESLKSGRNIKKIIVEVTASGDKIDKILKLATNKRIEILKADRGNLNRMSVTKNHEGVIALTKRIEPLTFKQFTTGSNFNKNNIALVVLRGIIHDQNLGAIIRSAAASGIDAIALTKEKKGFFINPNIERISEGGSNYVTFIKESFFSLLKNLKKDGFKIIAVENNADNFYFNEDFSGRVAFIFGNEAETLDTKNIDGLVKIPMEANLSSLNVSVSAGVIFYERYRQLNKNLWKN